MRSFRRLVPALTLLAVPALAEPWITDPGHTRILFEVEHLGFSTMPGIFREFAVELDFDPQHVERSALHVVVDTASIDMFHEQLNEHLRSDDFFAVAGHPTMEFRSTHVVPVDEDHAQVFGDLTLLGVTREIVLDVSLNQLGPHPMSGKEHVGFSATGTVDRTEFGMDYAAPAVGRNVVLSLDGEFTAPEGAAD